MANEPNDEFDSQWRMAVINSTTGEVRALTPDEEVKRGRQNRKARLAEDGAVIPPKVNSLYFRVYKTNWHDLVCKSDLSFAQLGLLVGLMAFADWGTNRLVHPTTKELLSIRALAELLDKNRKHLSESLYALEEKGLVALIEHGASNYILLNAQVLYFGKFMANIPEHRESFKEKRYRPVIEVIYRDTPQK